MVQLFQPDSRSYSEKLKDHRMIAVAYRIWNERGGKCECCGAPVRRGTIPHHGVYTRGVEPWDHPYETYWLLCWPCHKERQIEWRYIRETIGRVHPKRYGEILSFVRCLECETFQERRAA